MEIILQFLTFDLEYDPLQVGEGDCKYDWLDIWDGIPMGMKYIYLLTKRVNAEITKLYTS